MCMFLYCAPNCSIFINTDSISFIKIISSFEFSSITSLMSAANVNCTLTWSICPSFCSSAIEKIVRRFYISNIIRLVWLSVVLMFASLDIFIVSLSLWGRFIKWSSQMTECQCILLECDKVFWMSVYYLNVQCLTVCM